jgi:glycosyltransferase involved in cell wall biosynthesis
MTTPRDAVIHGRAAPGRTVLIISYAWPPAGGAGVQRVLKFVKYLPEYGFRPVVLTVEGGTYAAEDATMVGEVAPGTPVYRSRSAEPAALYRRFTGMKKGEPIPVAVLAERSLDLRKRIAHFIRLNLFVPDAKIGWLPFAVREGSRAIRLERPDVIFSSAPPPTTHLVAEVLARHFRLPWVADFRDPWTEIHYYEGHSRLAPARAMDTALERSVIRHADRLVFVTRLDSERYRKLYGHADKHVTITNGYDEADFQSAPHEPRDPERFVLMHLGSIGTERNPERLYTAIANLSARGLITPRTFRLVLVGKVEPSVVESYRCASVEPFVEQVPYVPHREAVRMAQRAHALLLLVTRSEDNERILPGKTFEYLRHGRPVLALGPPDGEVARVLEETCGGRVLRYDDGAGITRQLESWIDAWKAGRAPDGPSEVDLDRFSRRHLTMQLSKVLASATSAR